MFGPEHDRNLLFGILAYQNAFIGKEDLLSAMQVWLREKHRSLAEILQDAGKLGGPRFDLVTALFEEHLKQHAGDPERSLAAIGSVPSVRPELESMADSGLQRSLNRLGQARHEESHGATLASTPAVPGSLGMRYRILRLHDVGGLGKVHVAIDRELPREVALKELQERYADDDASRTRFLQEAEITGGLEHPGIVPVYGLGTYGDGRPYYAMRFIRGDNLKEAIERHHAAPGNSAQDRPLEFRKLLGRFVDVCEAIAYAHSRGVLHRDLKPGNIMLGKYGETLVVDWGLAKSLDRLPVPEQPGPGTNAALDQETPLRPSTPGGAATLPGMAIGTPEFMSPEQAAGRLDLLGPASDVYSLGATLYAVLTGKPPFQRRRGDPEGHTPAVLRKVDRGEFDPPRRLKPEVPAALEAVCLKAMAREPRDRYPGAKELAEDIERWLAEEPVSAYREGWRVRLGRWMRRHRTAVSSAAAALVVAVVALAVLTVLQGESNRKLTEANQAEKKATLLAEARERETAGERDRARQEQQAAEAARQSEQQQRERAEAAVRREQEEKFKAQHHLYGARMQVAQKAWRDLDFVQLGDVLRRMVPSPGQPDHRHFEWGYLWRRLHDRYEHTPEHLLKLDMRGHLVFAAAAPVLAHAPSVLLPDNDRRIRVQDVRTGKELHRSPVIPGRIRRIALDAEGTHLAWASGIGTVTIRRLKDDEETCKVAGYAGHDSAPFESIPFADLVFSPDADKVAFAGKKGTVVIAEVATGRVLQTLTTGHAQVAALAFHPDGDHLACGGYTFNNHRLELWKTGTGERVHSLKGPLGFFSSAAFDKYGKRVYGGTVMGTVGIWDVATGKESQMLTLHKGAVTSLLVMDWDLVHEALISGSLDGTVRVSVPKFGQSLFSFAVDASPVVHLALSEKDRLLRVATRHPLGTMAASTRPLAEHPDSPLVDFGGRLVDHAVVEDGILLLGASENLFVGETDHVKAWRRDEPSQLHSVRQSSRLVGEGWLYRVAASPSGSRIATIRRDAAKGELVQVQDPKGKILHAFSLVPFKGRGMVDFLAFLDEDTLAVRGEGGSIELRKIDGKIAGSLPPGNHPVFSSDRNRIALVAADGSVQVHDLRTGKIAFQGQPAEPFSRPLALAFGGDDLLAWLGGSGLHVHDLATGKTRFSRTLGEEVLSGGFAFSPDGKRLACITGSKQNRFVRVYETMEGAEILELKVAPLSIDALAFSRDGRTLLGLARDPGRLYHWDASPPRSPFVPKTPPPEPLGTRK